MRDLPSEADGLLGRLLFAASSVLLRFLALNLSSPLARVTGARHTNLLLERNRLESQRPVPIHFGPAAHAESSQRARPSHETKWLVLCSVWQFTSLGAALGY